MLRRYSLWILLLLTACGGGGGYRDTSITMQSVQRLEVGRYLGQWFEIARFPNRFEAGCTGVTADYNLRDDGRISVTNTCYKDGLDGIEEVAEGTARVVAPGQLKVKFVSWLPFEGDYWVIALDEGYRWAVVGTPGGDFGWILARAPQLTAAELDMAIGALRRFGYDVSALEYTLQPGGGSSSN